MKGSKIRWKIYKIKEKKNNFFHIFDNNFNKTRGALAHAQLHIRPLVPLNTNSKLEDQQIHHSTLLYLLHIGE